MISSVEDLRTELADAKREVSRCQATTESVKSSSEAQRQRDAAVQQRDDAVHEKHAAVKEKEDVWEVLEEYLLGGDHEWESEHRITVGSENGTGYKLGDRADGKKNINTCTQAELEAVNLVGPTRAASIIAGRPYYAVDDAALFDILEANMDIGTTIAGYVGASFYAPPLPGHLLVGLRFGGIDVPQGARVVSAYVALRVEEVEPVVEPAVGERVRPAPGSAPPALLPPLRTTPADFFAPLVAN